METPAAYRPALKTMEPAALPAAEFERVFRENYAGVYRAAYRITGNAEDAEDVLQTVFLRMWKRDAAQEPVENLSSFLYRSAINAALDVVRSHRRKRDLPLEELEPVLADPPHRRPDRAHAASEIREWLRHAVARLNPREAQMFILRFFEGKDNPEIARLLDTTPGTVAVTLSRTRSRLEKEFRLGGIS
jgi:RNA polymerase sigma-70 factor, ECF subfamily